MHFVRLTVSTHYLMQGLSTSKDIARTSNLRPLRRENCVVGSKYNSRFGEKYRNMNVRSCMYIQINSFARTHACTYYPNQTHNCCCCYSGVGCGRKRQGTQRARCGVGVGPTVRRVKWRLMCPQKYCYTYIYTRACTTVCG